MKLPKEIYTKNAEGVIEPIAFDKAIAALAKEHGLKKPDALELVKDVLKEDNQYDYSQMEAEDAKAHKSHAAAAAKLVADSAKNKEALNKALQDEEDAQKKQGQLIVLASEEGAAKAQKFELATVSAMQGLVGNKFVASEFGLTVAEGVTLTPKDMSETVRVLADGSEGLNKVRSKFLTNLGDSVNIAHKLWGEEEGDNIIAQAIREDGQGKHMVMQSGPVMAYIDTLYPEQKDRPTGLSFTHLQELKNYGKKKDGSNAIAPAKVRSIAKKAVDEKLSCADMRDLLKAARPQEEKPLGEEGEGEATEVASTTKELFGFVFIECAKVYDRAVPPLFREELDDDLLKEKEEDGSPRYLVLDLKNKACLTQKGKPENRFAEEAAE